MTPADSPCAKDGVTVIIPTYNRRDLLEEALGSVLAQTLPPLEVIVADDGSTDGSAEYAAARAAEHPALRFLPLKHRGFPGRVRNAGARAARGRYLAFLDSDDLWEPEKLAKQLAFFAAHPDIRICHTRERWLRNGQEVSQAGQRHRRSGDLFADSLKKCIIGPSTVMLERTLFEELGGFREDLEIAEDYELWLRLTASEQVGYIDEPLTIKRAGHGNQLSEKYSQIEIFRIRALKDLVESGWFSETRRRKEAAAELARKCRIYASGCEKRGRSDEARRYTEIAARYASG
jgi:glycosyltransferase involved in cell wall biosynthesis